MVKILWTDESIKDLRSIHDYIAKDSHISAKRQVAKLISKVEILISFPEAGRIVPEFQNQTIRELIEGNYRVVYRLKDQLLEIIRIHHSARHF